MYTLSTFCLTDSQARVVGVPGCVRGEGGDWHRRVPAAGQGGGARHGLRGPAVPLWQGSGGGADRRRRVAGQGGGAEDLAGAVAREPVAYRHPLLTLNLLE